MKWEGTCSKRQMRRVCKKSRIRGCNQKRNALRFSIYSSSLLICASTHVLASFSPSKSNLAIHGKHLWAVPGIHPNTKSNKSHPPCTYTLNLENSTENSNWPSLGHMLISWTNNYGHYVKWPFLWQGKKRYCGRKSYRMHGVTVVGGEIPQREEHVELQGGYERIMGTWE